MTANNSSAAARRRVRRAVEVAQALVRDTCGHMGKAKRIIACGRIPTGGGNPTVARHGDRAHMSGLQTCGSVWACPACSYKIRIKRAVEISLGVARHLQAGGGVLHIVVTMPHRAGEALADLWKILSDCWAAVTSGSGWKTFRRDHGVAGYVRSTEVTHSYGSGWHPHCHVLLFTDEPMSPVVNEDAYYSLRKAIRTRWCKRMAEHHGRTMSEEFGIRVDPVKADDADGSGQYLTKVGYELAMVDSKIGREDGHRTPFAIAHDSAETGDMADINLYREWIDGSHNKRSITWSKGLRDQLGLGPEQTDEELASEDIGSQPVAEIDINLWRLIARRRDATRSALLACFEIDDHHQALHQAAELLRQRLGVPVVVAGETGRLPTLGLDQTHQPNNAFEEQPSC